jgi:hypothetical protein
VSGGVITSYVTNAVDGNDSNGSSGTAGSQ